MAIYYTLFATILISLCSFVGVLGLYFKKNILNKALVFFVAFSAGTLIGGAFLHLVPEALENLPAKAVSATLLAAFTCFYLIEKIFHWHHHHDYENDSHTMGYLNLIADAIHNFIDGVIIASSFYVSFELGVVTSLAVILHEIPQELGDFAVMLNSGFSLKKALVSNFIVALVAVLGGLLGSVMAENIQITLPYLTAFAAGGFIYISSTDLIPEIKQERDSKKSFIYFFVFLLGVSVMYVLI